MTAAPSRSRESGGTAPLLAVVVGVSAGGVDALASFLPALPASFPAAVVVVQHLSRDDDGSLAQILGRACSLGVAWAEDKIAPRPGWIYLAPPNYHLLVGPDRAFALGVDPPVNFSRPSIDVLFETAAEAWGPSLAGVILTGANADGARGLARVVARGGRALVQDPSGALAPEMPRAALALVVPHAVGSPAELAAALVEMAGPGPGGAGGVDGSR